MRGLKCGHGCFMVAMVHVSSHSRQRQAGVTVMTLPGSMIRPLQNGQTVGRTTVSWDRKSGMSWFRFLTVRHRTRMRASRARWPLC